VPALLFPLPCVYLLFSASFFCLLFYFLFLGVEFLSQRDCYLYPGTEFRSVFSVFHSSLAAELLSVLDGLMLQLMVDYAFPNRPSGD